MAEMKIFTGQRNHHLAEEVCRYLQCPMGKSETKTFPDGELLVKLEEDVRGKHCFVLISTCEPVNDNLMEMLIFCDSLRRASAKEIVIVVPYFGYGRQDRKDEGRVPISAKLVANMMTTAGATRILAVDLHAAQIQGFFDLPVDHISATPIFLDYFLKIREDLGDLCLLSPDVGNIKVAEKFADLLQADLAIIHKRRIDGSKVKASRLIGNVSGKTVLMFDDMISTASTMYESAKIAVQEGASSCIAAATHGLFVGNAVEKLLDPIFNKIITTNTCTQTSRIDPLRSQEKFVELCVGPLIGEAINRIYHNKSVSALFAKTAGVKR